MRFGFDGLIGLGSPAPSWLPPYLDTRLRLGLLLALLGAPGLAAGQDTVVVRADGAGVWGREPRLVEEVRIGMIDGDERYILGRVAGVAVTADGEIWVAEPQLGAIRRYDQGGVHLGDVGRKGEGPGEFSSYLASLRLLDDGTIAAWDPGLQRISRFDADGAFVGSVRVPNNGVVTGPEPFEVDTAGRMYAVSWTSEGRSPPTIRLFWIRLRPDGQVLDTVRLYESRGGDGGGTVVHRVGRHSALSPHGYLFMGRNDEYAFHRPLPDGRTLRIERAWEPVRYRRAERAEAQRLEDHSAARRGRSPGRIPAEKPVWRSIDVDAEGRLWVLRYAPGFHVPESEPERERREQFDNPPREWRQPVVYDVIDADGRFLGTLRFPGHTRFGVYDGSTIALARDRHVWAVEYGEFDEPYVVRYRIEPGRS